MEYTGDNIVFTLERNDTNEHRATITIKLPLVEAMYQQALLKHQKNLKTEGFSRGTVPLSYIEYTCKKYILEHLKEFFFKHCVVNFLYQQLQKHKIVIAGEPHLHTIHLEPSQDAIFEFSFIEIKPNLKNEWKKYHFKTPSRKNYKDLDRQVTTFLKEEKERQQLYCPIDGIKPSDWISFTVSLLNEKEEILLKDYQNPLWMRIGKEAADREAHNIFLDHKMGDVIITKNHFLQNYLSSQLDTDYTLKITLVNHIPHDFFCFEKFKHHFKIKTSKDLHRRLIEVFSFRNDISQRREIIEATFKTLFKQYRINVPRNLIAEQEKLVLKAVQRNPDYHVYRSQKDFYTKVHMLAEKQLKEMILIDHISFQENISITKNDVQSYLNLHQRPRTKEFIYFDLPTTQLNGQEQPLHAGIVNQSCLREKTLNFIINQLARTA